LVEGDGDGERGAYLGADEAGDTSWRWWTAFGGVEGGYGGGGEQLVYLGAGEDGGRSCQIFLQVFSKIFFIYFHNINFQICDRLKKMNNF
jgi:hypothetical protein